MYMALTVVWIDLHSVLVFNLTTTKADMPIFLLLTDAEAQKTISQDNFDSPNSWDRWPILTQETEILTSKLMNIFRIPVGFRLEAFTNEKPLSGPSGT